jgi:hypothetical protein
MVGTSARPWPAAVAGGTANGILGDAHCELLNVACGDALIESRQVGLAHIGSGRMQHEPPREVATERIGKP